MNNFALFLSTSDGYSDCWDPFFYLLKKYWPSFSGPIYISTEFKDYQYDGLNVIPLKVSQKHHASPQKQPTWSKRMRWALEMIPEETILFMQEDFLLKDYVDIDTFNKHLNFFNTHKDVKCLHLTDCGPKELTDSEYPDYSYVIPKQPFRVSCQVALWKKQEILFLLRDRETAWDFEGYGSKRSAAANHLYLAVHKGMVKYDEKEIIPYLMTGIIKGKWNKGAKALFDKNNINVDLSIRGFYSEPNGCKKQVTRPQIIKMRYKSFINYIDMFFMKCLLFVKK
jgi:hypothetical protein